MDKENKILSNEVVYKSNTETTENNIIKLINDFGQQEITFDYCKQKLIKIYSPNDKKYRHKYGKISRNLNLFKDKDALIDVCNELISNLKEELEQNPNNDDTQYLIRCLQKLSDHIDLELFREEIDKERVENIIESSEKLEQLQIDFNEAETKLNKTEKKLNEAETKLDKAEINYITTLGIFIAIVLFFTGSFFTGGVVLKNLNETSIFKILFAISVLSICLINTTYVMFYWLMKILERNFFNKCFKTASESCDNCLQNNKCEEKQPDTKKCNVILKWIYYNSSLVFINFAFMVLIAISVVGLHYNYYS